MGRLIDADALIEAIWEKHKETEACFDLCVDELKEVYCGVVATIDEQPTAYDIEKVVGMIDEALLEFGDGNNCASCVFKEMCDNGYEGCVETMVDVCRCIVREGGIDG